MYKSLWGRGGGRANFYTGGVCVTAGYFNQTCRRRLLPRSPTRWSTSPPFWRGLAGRGSERSGRSCCCCRPRRLTEVSEASAQNQTLVLIVHVTTRLRRFIKEAKPSHDYMILVMNEERKYNRIHSNDSSHLFHPGCIMCVNFRQMCPKVDSHKTASHSILAKHFRPLCLDDFLALRILKSLLGFFYI